MVHPSLQVVLDEPARRYPCGAAIAGTVVVTAHESSPDRHLVVAVGYRASGSAPNTTVRNWGHVETRTLFSGGWLPGTYRYAFSVTAPDAVNYAGEVMTVAWCVRADIRTSASVPFDVVATTEVPIEPAASPVTPADRVRREASACLRRVATRAPRGCLLTSLVLLVLGGVVVWFGAAHDFALPGAVVGVAGLAGIGFAIRQSLVGRKVAATELRIGATVVWPGVVIPCCVTLEPASPFAIESATVLIEGWEHVKKFTGLGRSTGPVNKHVVHTREFAMVASSQPVAAGTPVRLTADVEIPDRAASTFDLDNEVKFRWRLVFTVRIAGSPDWFDAAELTVLPRVDRVE